MTNQHPITPSPELMKKWIDAWYNTKVKHENITEFVAIQAANWGADKELEACMEWLDDVDIKYTVGLCIARRPLVQHND